MACEGGRGLHDRLVLMVIVLGGDECDGGGCKWRHPLGVAEGRC